MKTRDEKIKEILERGVENIIDANHFGEILKSGRKLRVKFGIDPTSPDLHLGHMVPLRKLLQFQNAGHKAVLIVGDFTARIGDPSGRSEERKMLSEKEVKNNMKTYFAQAGKILNIDKTEVRYNSEWFGARDSLAVLFELARAGSMQQILRRADFKTRIDAGRDVTVLEMLYPLMQGYDSVVVRADAELGGSDQRFNLLMGRKVQRHFGVPEQDILIMPLLEGTDGARKMSKSYENYIAFNEKPNSMFAKVMSVPDALVQKYFLLLTGLSGEEIKRIEKLPILERKKRLAFEITSLLHSKATAEKARENFEKAFSEKETPANLKTFYARTGEEWADFLARAKLAKSKSDAKRLIAGGGVDLNGRRVLRAGGAVENGVVKIGKYKFIKVEVK
ncbi:MAG: tyrosine--tRNA ligase [Candidatus Giovannonibacteria bacterium]|nr:MAG: tyrosine--tRNA ligase [Candidatus Giovannonibacteria bacterium]